MRSCLCNISKSILPAFTICILSFLISSIQCETVHAKFEWKLISAPCDTSIKELRDALLQFRSTADESRRFPSGWGSAPEIYEWDGTGYRLVTELKAGHGYVVDRGVAWPPWKFCRNSVVTEDVVYTKGWNLVGPTAPIPGRSNTLHQMFGEHAQSVYNYIYALSSNYGYYERLAGSGIEGYRGCPMTFSEYKGYWVYFNEDTTLPMKGEYTVKLKFDDSLNKYWKNGRLNFNILDSLPLRATLYGNLPGRDWSTEIESYLHLFHKKGEPIEGLGEIQIVNSDDSVVAINSNWNIYGIGEGTATVYIKVGEVKSNEIEVRVTNDCEKLQVTMLNKNLSTITQIDEFRYRDNQDSIWDRSSPYVFDLDEAMADFYGDIWNMFYYNKYCIVGGHDTYDSRVTCAQYTQVFDYYKHPILYPGQQMEFQALCQRKGSKGYTVYKRIPRIVDWYISDDSHASITLPDPADENLQEDTTAVLTAIQPGTVTVHAELGKAVSDDFVVDVTENKLAKVHLFAITHKYDIFSEKKFYETAVSDESELKLSSCTATEKARGYNCYFTTAGGDAQLVVFKEYSNGSVERADPGDFSWSVSDAGLGTVDASGMLTTGTAGDLTVHAVLDGVESNRIRVRIFNEEKMDVCDEQNQNTSVWLDPHAVSDVYFKIDDDRSPASRATISTNCASYSAGEDVNIFFSAHMNTALNGRNADVCYDLKIKDAEGNDVRTIKYAGCDQILSTRRGLVTEAEGFVTSYEYLGIWDMRTDDGKLVPPGEYTAFAQFNIRFDPIVEVNFTVE